MQKEKKSSIEQLKYRQHLQKLSIILQEGDFEISQFIEHGFILHGQSRSGKTAAAHFLCGNPLKGFKINGQEMVDVTTQKNRKAKIGNDMNSSTLIPNFFELIRNMIKNLNGKVYVVDTPGYLNGDRNVLKLLANGYFNYRLYSKVRNMKFIVCFDINEFGNKGVQFVDTLIQFTSSFKNYHQNKQKIWNSCAFLFTKVNEDECSQKVIFGKLYSLIEDFNFNYIIYQQQKNKGLKDFIKFMIDNKRIFYIKRIKNGEIASSGDLLQKIDSKVSHWWSRQMDYKKHEINMESVQFSLDKQIIRLACCFQSCVQQFSEFIQYYNIRIKEFLKEGYTSLSSVLNQLVNDAMIQPQSHMFLHHMEDSINKYYTKFYICYKQEREKKEKDLFVKQAYEQNYQSALSRVAMKDKNYLIKKFHTLQTIQKLKSEINDLDFEERNLEWLEECQKSLYNIISELSKVSYKKKYAVQKICKYGYLIHRVVQEAKMFLVLVKFSASPNWYKEIEKNCNYEFIDLMKSLKDFMASPYIYSCKDYDYKMLHKQFVNKFTLYDLQNQNLIINEPLMNFFSSIDSIEEFHLQKIAHILLKYSDQVLNDSSQQLRLTSSSVRTILQNLTTARLNYQQIYLLNENQESRRKQMSLMRNITNNIGKMLQKFGKYKLARKVFDTIRFVNQVCKFYKLQIDVFEKNMDKQYRMHRSHESMIQLFSLRMEYCTYLADHSRKQEAMNVFQQTFEMAQNLNELETIQQELSELRLKLINNSTISDYQEKIFNKNYFQPFTPELQQEIYAITRQYEYEDERN